MSENDELEFSWILDPIDNHYQLYLKIDERKINKE